MLMLFVNILHMVCKPSQSFQITVRSRKIACCSSRLALSSTADDATVSTGISFETPPMRVYIEDTDAYGIMYNANYLRCFDRALHLTTTANTKTIKNLVTSQHEGWSIVAMGQQKFVSSPALGGDFVVQATLKESADDWEIWDMQMTSPENDSSTVYNKITNLRIAKPLSEDTSNNNNNNNNTNIFSLQHIEAFSFDQDNVSTAVDTFTIYRDEIDAHWTGHLPLRNVLNLFERARTNFFGGPDNLRKLQQEDGILAVVTAVTDCSLIDEGVVCYPGQQVDVETVFVAKRKGMILECWQTLKSGTSRLAQGKVSLMMLDANTRRPTSKLPIWVRERIGLL